VGKLWGGRFTDSTDAFVEAFTASVQFDQRMAAEDIEGSRAHATMLAECGVLSKDDHAQIIRGLAEIEAQKSATPASACIRLVRAMIKSQPIFAFI